MGKLYLVFSFISEIFYGYDEVVPPSYMLPNFFYDLLIIGAEK